MGRDLQASVVLAGLFSATLGCGGPTTTEVEPDDTGHIRFTRSSAELERRDQPAEHDDLLILRRTEELLTDESVWNRQDDRRCLDDERNGQRSLFCALYQASLDVVGEYGHRRLALQEVRFAVEDATGGRAFEHRLRDFNNLPETEFADIRQVLDVAFERVSARLEPVTR